MYPVFLEAETDIVIYMYYTLTIKFYKCWFERRFSYHDQNYTFVTTKTVSLWTRIQGGQTIRVERSTVLDLDVIAPGTARFKANFARFSIHDTVR